MPGRRKGKQANGAIPQNDQEKGAIIAGDREGQPGEAGVDPEHRLVVIGSSAGGIQALSVLVGTLPIDFSAPIVLAQHLDPNRPSNLTAILHQRTTLPVVTVGSSTLLEAGKIYVVPSDRHVSISDGHVEISEFPDRPKPSVDLLLTSAAKVYGERLIAVVLTGSGNDGAAGAVEVKSTAASSSYRTPIRPTSPLCQCRCPPRRSTILPTWRT
ncbi:MAG TPA: chemotaxis protein CheB [Chloroflexia bacterium]|nr:chemotaxis protein CheB [Chloroflexia bacterium]